MMRRKSNTPNLEQATKSGSALDFRGQSKVKVQKVKVKTLKLKNLRKSNYKKSTRPKSTRPKVK